MGRNNASIQLRKKNTHQGRIQVTPALLSTAANPGLENTPRDTMRVLDEQLGLKSKQLGDNPAVFIYQKTTPEPVT